MAITDVLKLIQGISGQSGTTKSTSSGGTQTTQTQLNQSTLDALLKSALEGNQGLASVAQGQVGAGLYNSSTNTMLTNDLLARLTTDVAAKGAPTVTTTSPQTTTSVQSTPGLSTNAMLGLGAVSLFKDPLDKLLRGKGGLLDFGDSSSSVDAAVGAMAPDMSTAALSNWSVGDSGVTDMADAAFNSGSGAFDNWFSDNYANVSSTISDTVGDVASDSGGDSGDWLSGIGDAVSGVKDWFADLF